MSQICKRSVVCLLSMLACCPVFVASSSAQDNAVATQDEAANPFARWHVQDVKVRWASWGPQANAIQMDVTETLQKQIDEQGIIKWDLELFNAVHGDPSPGTNEMLIAVLDFGDRVVRVELQESAIILNPAAAEFPAAGDENWNAAEIQRKDELLGDNKKNTGVIWARWGNNNRGGNWQDVFATVSKQIKGVHRVYNKRKNLVGRGTARSPNKMLKTMLVVDGHPIVCNLRWSSKFILRPEEGKLGPPVVLSTAASVKKAEAEKAAIREALIAGVRPVLPVESGVDDAVVELPGKLKTIRFGASGRLAFVHIPEKNSLVFVDLVKREFIKTLQVPDNVAFAANHEKLFIALPRANQLQRWDLTTLERDKAVMLDRNTPPDFAVMGPCGDGPLALSSKGKLQLWDAESVKPIELEGQLLGGGNEFKLRVSADGKHFSGWERGASVQAFAVMRIFENTTRIQRTNQHRIYQRWAIPSADGSILLAYQNNVYTYDLRQVPLEEFKGADLFPTDDARFLIAVRRKNDLHLSMTIVTASDFQALHTLEDFKSVCNGKGAAAWQWRGGEPCMRYLPALNLAMCLPESQDKIVIRDFDLEKTLETTQENYVYVISKPQPAVKMGETFSYQVSSLSSSKEIEYLLDAGPEGMTMTPDGRVNWPVNKYPNNGIANVIITATSKDGGLAVHAFELFVEMDQDVASADEPGDQPGMKDGASNTDAAPAENPSTDPAIPREFVANLPGKVESLRTGGGGHLLIMQFADSENLAVFDVRQRTIVKYVPAPAKAVFAASRDKLVIVDPTSRILERWDLKSFRRDKTAQLESEEVPTWAAMGANGDGPLALWGNHEIELWDIDKMRPIRKSGPRLQGKKEEGYKITVSADGKTFCGSNSRGSRQYVVMRFDGKSTTIQTVPGMDQRQHWAMLSADGSIVCRADGKAHNYSLEPMANGLQNVSSLLPTNDPRFLIAVRNQGREISSATICTASNFAPITTIENLNVIPQSSTSQEPMLRYLIEDELFIVLPISRDRLILKNVELENALKASPDPYLFVHSKPNASVNAGDTFNYQIETWSSSDTVNFELKSAPSGMTLSKDGLVKWPIEKRPVGGSSKVSIVVSNADGEQLTHAFKISIERKPTEDLADASEPGPAKTGGQFVKLDNAWLELPQAPDSIATGLNNRMLLVFGKRLAIFGPDGWTVEKLVNLDKSYVKVVEREDYYVAICNEPPGVHVLNKETLKVERSLQLSVSAVTDVALHPTLPISYVCTRRHDKIPHYKFIIFGERTGAGRENDEWIGNWVAVERNGDFLVTAYSDTYRSGSRLLLNPNQWHVVPEYGSLDWLIRYDIDTDGMPLVSEVKDSAGANGTGIRMSSDGKRVTYLSHVGYPRYSKNLGGWDSQDFSLIPVVYETKDRSTTKEMAFHPTLPIAASPGVGTVVFFDRETGSIEERIDGSMESRKDSTIHRIFFSPDGKNLICDFDVNGVRYLRKVVLKLSPDELSAHSALSGGAETNSTSEGSATSKVTVRLTEFDALAGGIGEDMTAADIARSYSESVVVIQSGDVSGTGFVVGNDGYVLTCAHCVPTKDDVRVTFVRPNGNTMELNGQAVIVDSQNDLALVKIRQQRTFKSVALALGHEVETGMPVTVIGNPGVGDQILDHTMTEGIVSTPRRDIDGLPYIQTTAAINPGSSGGPMFNERGMVIGMVVLKARIEGAGFAIPADTIARFLMKHMDSNPDSMAIERSWYDAEGNGPVLAVFLGYRDGQVQIKRTSDDEEFSIPIETLSLADQAFVKMLHRQKRDQNR